MTDFGHNTSYIQILPYGAATSVGALFIFGGRKHEKILALILTFCICISGFFMGCKKMPPSESQTADRFDSIFGNLSTDTASANASNIPTKNIMQVKYTFCGEFQDGFAFIAWEQGKEEYGAMIDVNGNIIYQTTGASGLRVRDWRHLGNGAAAIEFKDGVDTVFAIINSKGELIKSSKDGDFDRILATGDGMALVYKEKASVVSIEHLYGTLDVDGNWIHSLTKGSDDSYSAIYGGEGMFWIPDEIINYYVDINLYKHSTYGTQRASCFSALNINTGDALISADMKYCIRGRFKNGIVPVLIELYDSNGRDISYYIYVNMEGKQVLQTLTQS